MDRPIHLPVLALAAILAAGCLKFQQRPLDLQDRKNIVELGRQRIYVEESGQPGAPAVLLVHGFGASGKSWRRVRPALERRYRVLTVDLPGFGRSDKYEGDYSIRALAAKLVRLLDAKKVRSAHIVAHSWGTAIALAAALDAPSRVRSLALIAPFAFEEQLPPFLVWARAPLLGEYLFATQWKERLDDRLSYSFFDPEPFVTPAAVDEARSLFDSPGALAASLAAVRGMRFGALEKRYGTIRQAVLIISGRNDRVTRLSSAERLHDELQRSKQVVIPRCGHVPIIERPLKVIQALLEFLPRPPVKSVRTPGSRPVRPRSRPALGACP